MKCPNCDHLSDPALLQCSSCGEAFDNELLQEYQNLEYLIEWLNARNREGILMDLTYERLNKRAEQALADLKDELLPTIRKTEPSRPINELAEELALITSTLKSLRTWADKNWIDLQSIVNLSSYLGDQSKGLEEELVGHSVVSEEPSRLEAAIFALESLSEWQEKAGLANTHKLRRALEKIIADAQDKPQAADAIEEREKEAPKKPGPKASPIPDPKPAREPIDLSKLAQRVVDAFVSGAVLRVALFLGAFMIVVSTTILVVRFWNLIPQWLQFILIFSVPAAFYLAGWYTRTRMKLPQAGEVLTGIGALLLAVDFIAIFQLGQQPIEPRLYWLLASSVSAIVYVISARRIPTEFFGYIAALGVTASLVAFIAWLDLQLMWWLTSAAGACAGMAWVAGRLSKDGRKWQEIAQANRRLPQLLIPLLLITMVFLPGNATASQFSIFLFATITYNLLVYFFPSPHLAHGGVWTGVGTLVMLTQVLAIDFKWYSISLVLIAAGLLTGSKALLRSRREEDQRAAQYRVAARLAAFAVIVAGIWLGLILLITSDLWVGITGLSLAAIIVGMWAFQLKQAWLGLFAATLFVIPFSTAAIELLSEAEVQERTVWLLSSWVLLALAYHGIGMVLRSKDKQALGYYLVAQALVPLSIIGLEFNYLININTWTARPTFIVLCLANLFYLGAFLTQHSRRHPVLSRLANPLGAGIFLWPLGGLLPIALRLGWTSFDLPAQWLSAALAGLALAYAISSHLLAKMNTAYRRPLVIYAYLLSLISIFTAPDTSWALATTLYTVMLTLVAFVFYYRRRVDVWLAAALFVWPFTLTLDLLGIAEHAFSLAFAILVLSAYTPLAVVLDRKAAHLAPPVWWLGHILATLAALFSIGGRFGVYALDIPWVAVIVPLLVGGLSTFRLRQTGIAVYAWAGIVLLSLSYGQALTLLHVSAEYLAAAWAVFALALLAAKAGISQIANTKTWVWLSPFADPLGAGILAFGSLSLLLTAPGTIQALTTGNVIEPFPLILAQSLLIMVTAIGARLYHSRWPLFLEPWLAFLAVTLLFIGYGDTLLGRSLSTGEYSLVWLGLSAIHMLIGIALDRASIRYAHGPYAFAYLSSSFALVWSFSDRVVNLYTLGGLILLWGFSQVLVYTRRHRSFFDFSSMVWKGQDTTASRAFQATFLFLAAYMFPVWLTQLLAHFEVSIAWRGLALALAAPLYIAFGIALRPLKNEYSWPLYSGGYVLTVLGAMVALEDPVITIYVLILNAVVYAASAYIFRQTFWLYLTTTLLPIISLLVIQHNLQSLPAQWVAYVFIFLAFLYIGIGQVFDRQIAPKKATLSSSALPFYLPGFLLSALSLAVASGSANKSLAISVFLFGVVLYAIIAWAFKEPIFLYPAAWLLAVPYYLGMTMTSLDPRWYGLGWLPLIIAYIVIGHFVFERRGIGSGEDNRYKWESLATAAMPFYLLAYGLSISMILVTWSDPTALTVALTAASIIYFSSSALFQRREWLYPALLAAHLVIIAYVSIDPSGRPAHFISIPFLAATWLTTIAGVVIARVLPPKPFGEKDQESQRWPFLEALILPSWSQPFFSVAALDILLWQGVALGGTDTTIMVALGFALLLAILAMLWGDRGLPYGSLGLGTLALGAQLQSAGISFPESLVIISGLGFGLYLIGRVIESNQVKSESINQALNLWITPLTNWSVVLTATPVLLSLQFIGTNSTMTALVLGFAGALYLTIAYRGRYHLLGYLAVAMLELAWILILGAQQIRDPQFYAIPAGLYFVGIGFLERQRGHKPYAILIEGFGLAVLLLTSFILSLDGQTGFAHFLILLVESFGVVWWGAFHRLRIPFITGIVAIVLDVLAQTIVLINVYEINRWIVILGVGLTLITAAIFIERQREIIISRAEEWRLRVQTWN